VDFNELVRKWPDMTLQEQMHHAGLLSDPRYQELLARVKHAPNSNADILSRELNQRNLRKLFK
jgi:hypothetical protein